MRDLPVDLHPLGERMSDLFHVGQRRGNALVAGILSGDADRALLDEARRRMQLRERFNKMREEIFDGCVR